MSSDDQTSEISAKLLDWKVRQFHIFDSTNSWGPAVSRELEASWNHRSGRPAVSTSQDSRKLIQKLSQRQSCGLILMFDGQEKECLSILSRLMDFAQPISVAAVLQRHHEDLIPMLMESGVTTVIMSPTNDVALARWCLAVIDND